MDYKKLENNNEDLDKKINKEEIEDSSLKGRDSKMGQR